MSDKKSIKYSAFMNKESGEIVCTQLNCNYSIQVYDMAQNMSAIFINTSPNPQSQIEFYANNSTNPASQTYSNCNLGINENNFYLYNMNGGTIWNTDLLANISTFYMPLNVADTFTANNVSITGQLNLNDMILADPGNGFQLYGNDAQGYPTINFYSGSPGTGVLQYSMGVYNDIFYVIPNGGSQAIQVSSDMSVNIPYSLSICDGNGTFTCDGAATFNVTLTANTIVPTANGTGTIGSSALYYDMAYINYAYLGFIDTLVYMQNGASFYGPLQVLNPVTGDVIFTLTVNNGNQLNFASVGQTNPITIDAGSNTMNLPSDLIASGTVSCSTLTATTINPSPSSYSYAGTSGFAYVVQPFTGSGYKKVLIIFSSYNPPLAAVTFEFPVNFAGQYQVISNYYNLQYTLLSTEIEITNFNTSTTYNGGMTIEGW